MAIQVQHRRGTQAEIDAFTGAEGEFTYATDTKRAQVHDASTAGGLNLPSERDVVNNAFNYVLATGTANAITLTVAANITAYQAGQTFKFKAIATNTGATTVNVNGLGAVNIYKKDAVSVSVVAAEANDIITGGMYQIEYDGTQFQFVSTDGGGTVAASTAEIAAGSAVDKYIRPDRVQHHPSACKAWCYSSNGTNLDDAFNVSSITLLGSNNRRITFNTAMPDTNYSFTWTRESGSFVNLGTKTTGYIDSSGGLTTANSIIIFSTW